jgi:hypothetical protein
MKTHQMAVQIVDEIAADLSDRRGLGDEWDQLDTDVRLEILKAWQKIVKKYIA